MRCLYPVLMLPNQPLGRYEYQAKEVDSLFPPSADPKELKMRKQSVYFEALEEVAEHM